MQTDLYLYFSYTVKSFFMLCLGFIGMDCVILDRVIEGQFYKEILGKRPQNGYFPLFPL